VLIGPVEFAVVMVDVEVEDAEWQFGFEFVC